MIVTEKLTINGKSFVRTYSDSGFMVQRDGVLYAEAIDPENLERIYTESTEAIPLSDGQALEILLGGAV